MPEVRVARGVDVTDEPAAPQHPVPPTKIRVLDADVPYDVPRDSDVGKRLEAMVPPGVDEVHLVGPDPLIRPPSPESLGLLLAESVLRRALAARTRQVPQASGSRFQRKCRCSHAQGAHEGAQEDGPCASKLCRKFGRCAKFEEAPL